MSLHGQLLTVTSRFAGRVDAFGAAVMSQAFKPAAPAPVAPAPVHSYVAKQQSRFTHALHSGPSASAGQQRMQGMQVGTFYQHVTFTVDPRDSDCDAQLAVTSEELDRLTYNSSESLLAVAQKLATIGLTDRPSDRKASDLNYEPDFTKQPPRKWHRLDKVIHEGLDHAVASRDRGRNSTGVRAWISFCHDVMGTAHERPMDPNTPLWMRLEEEWLAMRFVCALVEDRGVKPETAAKYFSAVQGWHAREFGVKLAGGLKLERLPQMVKGLRRARPSGPPKVRRGISPEQLRKGFDRCLDPNNPLHANIRAAMALALQGLMRSAEYCGARSKETLLREDLTLSHELLKVMMHPCKNMRHISGKTCPLIIGSGGQFIDAVAEMHNLLRVDPASDSAPLFRDPATNEPLSYSLMLEWTKLLMAAIGENPDEFGTHSFRIGGATAIFAAGGSDMVIRTMGRWSSDIHRLYVRACYEQCLHWSRQAGSARVSCVQAEFDEVDEY